MDKRARRLGTFLTVVIAAWFQIQGMAQVLAQPHAARIELTRANYQDWRDHILPTRSELGWQQIPWLTTFQDGILAADDAAKPLLFWTMNGHPLGCT